MQYSITMPRSDVRAGKYGQGKCMRDSESRRGSHVFVQLHLEVTFYK
jgi:hypothetical protein